jgi:tetratricopeptide (TPR) repeat protein
MNAHSERSPSALCCLFAFVVLYSLSPAFAGEAQWVEVRSPNFSVVTDAGEKRGREVAMRFEQMRAVFGALITKANVNLPVPLQIVAFRNTKEMRQIAPLFNGKPTQVAGLFQGGEDRSFIMLDMSIDNPWVVVFHEYAHQLMDGNLPGEYAPWFEEGFAEYFSSIEVDGKEARVGKIPNSEYAVLEQLGMMKISDLFRVQQNTSTYNESGDHRSTFYAESGMLMHYIYDNHLMPKVGIYFDLTLNQHKGIEDAMEQAFGMNAQQFDRTLRDYASSGHFKYYPIPTPPSIASSKYTVAPLGAATGNAVLADIHLHMHDYQDQALIEFRDILKSDPNNLAACRGLGYAYLQKKDFTQAREYFKRASELDSKDPRVHYYNALLITRESGFGAEADVPAMTKELETSISLDPTFADSYALLAFAQSTSGDTATAIVTMGKAIAISPRNESYLFNLANLYMANRQPDQTITLLRSLQVTDNPKLAMEVAGLLAQARQFKQMLKAGAQVGEPTTTLTTTQPEEPQSNPANAIATPVRSGPTKFIKGTLTNADCATPPSVVLSVVSGEKTWKMTVADRNHLVLIGADSFSCSWSNQKVAINYRETNDGEANVISLEIQ